LFLNVRYSENIIKYLEIKKFQENPSPEDKLTYVTGKPGGSS